MLWLFYVNGKWYLISHPEECGFVKGDVRRWMNSDDRQTRPVALQDSNHHSEDDCAKLFVEKRLRFPTDRYDVRARVVKRVVRDTKVCIKQLFIILLVNIKVERSMK
jgi:hypothetical protein